MRAPLCALVALLAHAVAVPASAQIEEDGTSLSPPRATGVEARGEDLPPVPPPPSPYGAPRYVDGASAVQPPSSASTTDVRIPSRIATRLRVLEGNFQALAARSGNNILDGVLSLVTGGLVVGIAGWQWSEDKQLGGYLLLWGGASLARGVFDLTLTPNVARPSVAFTHMPMRTLAEVEARLAFGEQALGDIARRARLSRILEASVNMAVGAAAIPLYLAPNDFAFDSPFDYFVVIGSGISILSGLISLLSRSDAERRWRAYEELRDRLEATEEASLDPPRRVRFVGVGGGPLPSGAAVRTHWSF